MQGSEQSQADGGIIDVRSGDEGEACLQVKPVDAGGWNADVLQVGSSGIN